MMVGTQKTVHLLGAKFFEKIFKNRLTDLAMACYTNSIENKDSTSAEGE